MYTLLTIFWYFLGTILNLTNSLIKDCIYGQIRRKVKISILDWTGIL